MNDRSKDSSNDSANDSANDSGTSQGDGNQQRATNQGGHQGNGGSSGGHGGQHSGGMGGEHGGDLHDVGSGQSGMGGGAGSGGLEAEFRGSNRHNQEQQQAEDLGSSADDLIGIDETDEVQQSVQREGMGHHNHSSRGNEQAIDAAADIDKLGNHVGSAGKAGRD